MRNTLWISCALAWRGCKPLLPERVSDIPCLLLILKTLIAFQKMFPQNCKKVKSTNKEQHKLDQSQNCDSILPNQSIVSKEGFPWGAGHGTLRWTRASEQAGKALRSQGHQCAHVM